MNKKEKKKEKKQPIGIGSDQTPDARKIGLMSVCPLTKSYGSYSGS